MSMKVGLGSSSFRFSFARHSGGLLKFQKFPAQEHALPEKSANLANPQVDATAPWLATFETGQDANTSQKYHSLNRISIIPWYVVRSVPEHRLVLFLEAWVLMLRMGKHVWCRQSYQRIMEAKCKIVHHHAMAPRPSRPFLIAVVDDDESVREALESLLKSRGFKVDAYAAAEDFLSSSRIAATDCLILDVKLDGMSGPDLQQELTAARHSVPIIFVTAHADETLRSRVIQDGAIDCFMKPFNDDALLAAVDSVVSTGGYNR
jgi:CheY-like chemotaxis protein